MSEEKVSKFEAICNFGTLILIIATIIILIKTCAIQHTMEKIAETKAILNIDD